MFPSPSKKACRVASMEDGFLSQLPEGIIHHILSFLNTKEAAKISMFCKAWHSAWLTCPTLDFGEGLSYYGSDLEKQERLVEFIQRTLWRYQEQKIRIEQLSLPLIITDDDTYLDSLVNDWIRVAICNGVTRLDLYSPDESWVRPYTLPHVIFEAKGLQVLKLRGSNMRLTKQVGDKVMFERLWKLDFSFIYLDDDVFQYILARCPLIKILYVFHCRGLKRIKVTDPYNLRGFTIFAGRDQSYYIEIDSPRLQYLNCNLSSDSGSKLHLCSTENLKHLSLVGNLPSPTFLDNFMEKFPHVKDLRLDFRCDGLERINLSSPSLKRVELSLQGVEYLSEVKIEAPSIVSFKLHEVDFEFFPNISVINPPSQWVLKIFIRDIFRVGTCEFFKLNEFLAKLVNSKIFLHLSFHSDCRFYNVRQIQTNPALRVVEIEKLHLNLGFAENPNFLDDLFTICRPKAIMLRRYEAIEFLYKNLIEKRNQDQFTCAGTRSWYQDLQEVRFEIYDETKHVWRPSDGKRMLEAPWRRDKVCARLVW